MDESENLLSAEAELLPLNLQVTPALFRAYQRCTWIIINETGRSQHSIMEEMVRDFLIKYGC
jgi:hypothetical protein